jgi:hypothetical protein
MKKIIAILFVFIGADTVLSAQRSSSVFVELGGPGLASINYDSRFGNKEDGFGGRVGIGAFGLRSVPTANQGQSNTHATVIYIPVGVNYIMGNDDRNYFELGAGVTAAITNAHFRKDDFTSTFAHVLIGYRVEPEEGGITFRVFLSPAFGSFGFIPYLGGVSVGYKFHGKKVNGM